jgi:hypothetical protein
VRTALIIASGFALLAVFVLAGRLMARTPRLGMLSGAKAFLPLWLVLASTNMYVGITQAGYTALEEAPIFLLVFGLPGAVAGFICWKFS